MCLCCSSLAWLMMGKKWKACKDSDPCFLLDVQFLCYHAEKLLHARCLWSIWECLPSIDVLLTLQQSLDRIKELQQSPMLQEGQLGEDILLLDEIVGHLNMMQHAEGPTLSASASQTKRQLFQKYTLFFRWKVVEDTIEGPKVVQRCGQDGFCRATHLVRHLAANHADQLTLAVLKQFNGFKYMMSSEVRQEMREWLAIAAKNLENQDEDDENDDEKDDDFEAPLWSDVLQDSWAAQSWENHLKGLNETLGSPCKGTPKRKRKHDDDDEIDLKHMPW